MAFSDFWAAYPRREAKKDAMKAWEKLHPTPELEQQIFAALAWQTVTEQWTKDDGQYVPLPGTYLRNERWTDERRDQRRQTWAFDCPHTPLCVKHWDCVQKQRQAS